MTEPTSAQELFKGRHFDQEIIVLCVRWYLTFKLSWLCQQVLPRERNTERLKRAVYDRCRELHLEPPTPERIDRVVRSAARTYEESFCAEILARLVRRPWTPCCNRRLMRKTASVRQSLKCRGRFGTP